MTGKLISSTLSTSTRDGQPHAPDRRTAAEIMTESRPRVEATYRTMVDGLPPEIRHIAGYHIGWWDADRRPAAALGKAIRPALTLACARAAAPAQSSAIRTDGAADDRAVAAAMAVELVHDFSLLHDDVMDGDLARRHRPAAWAVFGSGMAILVGDVLLTAAIQHLLQRLDTVTGGAAAGVLSGAVLELCAGQAADLAFEQRGDVSVAEYLVMAEGKTGALLGAACQLGALAAGATARTAGHYREFGRQLGLAFQLTDDLLGIWGDEAVTGKPVGSDLRSRKKSAPVVAVLASGARAGARLAELYGRDGELDQDAVTQATLLIEQAGGRSWAVAETRRRVDAALTALRLADPEPAAAADLGTLAMFLTGRDH